MAGMDDGRRKRIPARRLDQICLDLRLRDARPEDDLLQMNGVYHEIVIDAIGLNRKAVSAGRAFERSRQVSSDFNRINRN